MFQSFEPTSDKGYAARHLPLFRGVLKEHALDGYLIPHDDEYQNEYLPDYAERLMWLSGFSGSAGFAVILSDAASIFSDGRYTLQLRDQVDENLFTFHQTPEQSPAEWLRTYAQNMRIGYDPATFTETSFAPFIEASKKANITLVPTSGNLVDEAWADQPAKPCMPILPHPLKLAGRSSADKRESIATTMKENGTEMIVISSPASIAWLFNIRGSDVHATPLPLCRAILCSDSRAVLFAHPDKLSDALIAHLGNGISLHDEDEIEDYLSHRIDKGTLVAVDPQTTPLSFVNMLTGAGVAVSREQDPCSIPRATKTEAELNGTRAAHVRDGVAVTKFLHWLDMQSPSNSLTEISVAQKLEEFRQQSGKMKDVSFDTISGAGAHGAIVHYRVTTKTDALLRDGSLYLIDSGAQYIDGTTDITRTIAIGDPTPEMIERYTLVLKGHIAIATARYPQGTSGHQIDAFARRALWDAGLDYDHGTGHGVGSYLGVHEGPQNISKKLISQPLLPGMICSNEPGFYKTGAYGIRIENLVIVTQPEDISGGDRPMLGFETVTLAPLDRRLIDKNLLTESEMNWVNRYLGRVLKTLSPELPEDTKTWLEAQASPL